MCIRDSVYPYDPAKSDEACITQLQKRFKADIADGPESVDCPLYTSTTGSKRPAACRFRSNGAFITGTATIAMRKLIKFVF